jgi:hypothetical protein
VWLTLSSSTQGLPHTARFLRRPTGGPLPGGMQTKRPSIEGKERTAPGSCPSQWRTAAALVGPSWTSLTTCRASSHSKGTFTRNSLAIYLGRAPRTVCLLVPPQRRYQTDGGRLLCVGECWWLLPSGLDPSTAEDMCSGPVLI